MAIAPTTSGKQPAPQPVRDLYFGRRDICQYFERFVKTNFPLRDQMLSECSSPRSETSEPLFVSPNASSSSQQDGVENPEDFELPDLGKWIAHVLYRTNLPKHTVFFAIHLLRRLASLPRSRYPTYPLFSLSHSESQPQPELAHFSLVLTSLALVTHYTMDDSYSVNSWCVASRELFLLQELNAMMFDMFRSLGWQIRLPEETLEELAIKEERVFAEEVKEIEERLRRAEEFEEEDEEVESVRKQLEKAQSILGKYLQDGGGGGGKGKFSTVSKGMSVAKPTKLDIPFARDSLDFKAAFLSNPPGFELHSVPIL